MSRRVNKVEGIIFPLVAVIHFDGSKLYCDSPFSFKLHRVKQLIFHITLGDLSRIFYKTVRKSTFSVVYMGYYAEVSRSLKFVHFFIILFQTAL